MVSALARAFKKAESLPEEEQNALAAIILEELENEERWSQAFAASQDKLAAMAEEVARDRAAGKIRRMRI